MAQVVGSLREDAATHGEKLVLKLLKENLPKEYFVYVECPLNGKRIQRFPDFIVLTNYGVIVLEVKDWVQIIQADRYKVTIRTRNNQVDEHPNPVIQARDNAILLNNELQAIARQLQRTNHNDIPWGYAVIMPNIGTATLSQLRRAWGEERVLNQDDLDPALIKTRLKYTLPEAKVRPLDREEMELVRGTINPTITIENPEHPLIILDDEQEKIITETVKIEATPREEFRPLPEQATLFADEVFLPSPETPAPEIEITISQNTSIRLVRGVAGSGKTLVLTQRARYLAAQYPEWSIAVLTFNEQLCKFLSANFKGISNIHNFTFHSLCSCLLRGYRRWVEPTNPAGWIENHRLEWRIPSRLSTDFLEDEFCWIKETGVAGREAYLIAQRKGRGLEIHLTRAQRELIYNFFEAYEGYLAESGIPDWADLPRLVLEGIASGAIEPRLFDAILIDEAQDFAPVWFKVIEACLQPLHGVLFLADDPAQSIYRFYSWREKGVNVVGRSRWLRVPYRNTCEIYQAAYRLIAEDPFLTQNLVEEGALVIPDLATTSMRHGPLPLMQKFANFEKEIQWIRSHIFGLLARGIRGPQIAVLGRKKNTAIRLASTLRGTDVITGTLHNFKGMEFEVVFLTQLQEAQVEGDDRRLSEERRLLYMAMTRARSELYLGYSYKMPDLFLPVVEAVDCN